MTRTLPAGNTWNYAYYGNGYVMPSGSPCGSTGINQGGALKTRTGPAPSGGTARVEEFVYDASGKPLGTRIGNDSWTCITYDARERPLTKTIPAYSGEPARTVTYNHTVGGNALVTSVNDNVGTIQTTADLLGRSRSSTDVWGKTVTSTYDQYGRVTGTVGPRPSDTTTNTYLANTGRLDTVAVDGATTARLAYDAYGRVNSVSYPNAAGGGNGNGTSSAPITRDALARPSGLAWNDPNGTTITSDAVTRTSGGDVTDETSDGSDADPAKPNFVYDRAGRLTTAKITGHTLAYGYGTATGCGSGAVANAGLNSNRTSVVDNATTTQSNCYDAADKLISTTQSGYGTIGYDSHGNTTTLGNEQLGYDGADRHVTSTVGTSQVRYQRDATDRIVERTVATVTAASTIAYRAASSTGGSTASSSITLNRPSGTQTGDVLIAQVGQNTGDNPAMVGGPGGWTPIASVTNGAVKTTSYWHVAAAGDPGSWAFTLSSGKPVAGGIVAYAGVDATSPVDSFATATNVSGTGHVAPAVTTSVANEEVVSLFSVAANTSWTPPSGSTERVDVANTDVSPVTVEVADTNIAAAGAVAARSATSAVGGVSATQTIVLRPAAGSATTTTVTVTSRYSAGVVLDGNGNVVERSFGLPGGVTVTKRTSSQVWSYPNLHGDVVATAKVAVKRGADAAKQHGRARRRSGDV